MSNIATTALVDDVLVTDISETALPVYCINCSHILIKNLIFNNTDMGVLFYNTINSMIENNKFEGNEAGIGVKARVSSIQPGNISETYEPVGVNQVSHHS